MFPVPVQLCQYIKQLFWGYLLISHLQRRRIRQAPFRTCQCLSSKQAGSWLLSDRTPPQPKGPVCWCSASVVGLSLWVWPQKVFCCFFFFFLNTAEYKGQQNCLNVGKHSNSRAQLDHRFSSAVHCNNQNCCNYSAKFSSSPTWERHITHHWFVVFGRAVGILSYVWKISVINDHINCYTLEFSMKC